MQSERRGIEEYFCAHLLTYARNEVSQESKLDQAIFDCPDAVIEAEGRRIAVELTQIPSKYIIRQLHKRPPGAAKVGVASGVRTVYPYEPHQWVWRAIQEKRKNSRSYAKRVRANESWLAIHTHTTRDDWPVFKAKSGSADNFNISAMRFGASNAQDSFDRVIFIHANGEVDTLFGAGAPEVKELALAEGAGYPAFANHHFSLGFIVPPPGLGQRTFSFENIEFTERIVPPHDAWMSRRAPDVNRPVIGVSGVVDSNEIRFHLIVGGVRQVETQGSISGNEGKAMFLHVLVESGYGMFEFQVDS